MTKSVRKRWPVGSCHGSHNFTFVDQNNSQVWRNEYNMCSLRGRDDCNWRFADTPLRCNTDRANRRNLLCREWSTVYTTSCPCLLSEKLTRWRMPPTQTTTIQSLINIAMCLFALPRWGWRLDRSPRSLLSLYFFALGFFAAFFLPFSVQQHTTPSYSKHTLFHNMY